MFQDRSTKESVYVWRKQREKQNKQTTKQINKKQQNQTKTNSEGEQ